MALLLLVLVSALPGIRCAQLPSPSQGLLCSQSRRAVWLQGTGPDEAKQARRKDLLLLTPRCPHQRPGPSSGSLRNFSRPGSPTCTFPAEDVGWGRTPRQPAPWPAPPSSLYFMCKKEAGS